LRLGLALGLTLLVAVAKAGSAPDVVIAHSVTVTPQFLAYAKVVPISVAPLRAARPGLVESLSVIPGDAVQAGVVLARLNGPEIAARLAQRRATVASERAALHAARRALASERQKRAARLSTRQAVIEARASVAQARARLAAAQAALEAEQNIAVLRSPSTGIVVSVTVANGERVGAGQRLLTVQPAHHLWLKAHYYGADSNTVHVGMRGRFAPADGAAPVTVQVVSLLPTVQPDGGLSVALRPTQAAAHWRSGEAGTVRLAGVRRTAVAVPTRALILDRGQWWVLVHTAQGDRRQAVTPGPSRGDQTLIEHGLGAGAAVVVANAYLRFHRGVSHHYQSPD